MFSSHVFFFFKGTTEAEAANFGRFLSLILAQVNKWRTNEEFYNRQLKPSPGFNLSFAVTEPLPFAAYVQKVGSFHKQIASATGKGLESKEYLVVRNSLQVLTKLVDVFPLVRLGKLFCFVFHFILFLLMPDR